MYTKGIGVEKGVNVVKREMRFINKMGVYKKAPEGFSWTVFFFGMFVPLFRADWAGFFALIGISAIVQFVFSGSLALAVQYPEFYVATILTAYAGVLAVNILVSKFYNKSFFERRMQQGWTLQLNKEK